MPSFTSGRHKPTACFLLIACVVGFSSSIVDARTFQVDPPAISLQGNFARSQVLIRADVAGEQRPEYPEDLTGTARYASSDSNVFTVDENGMLLAIADGSASLRVEVGSESLEVPVTVSQVLPRAAIDFDRHVRPVLSKGGCNAGACHASQHGKGGFVLSVFGFDPQHDYRSIVRERLGRRVDFVVPSSSLLLQKPTLQVSHGGGLRLSKDSVDYRVLEAWLANQAPPPQEQPVHVESLSVTPTRRVGAPGLTQQLRVIATYSDGQTQDVTAWAKFDSMDDAIVEVSELGRVTACGKGQAAVLVRFEGHAEISMFVIPHEESVELAGWRCQNFVDELAERKFRELGIEPSPVCDDATFLRRVYLDVLGTLPSVDETTRFLQSDDPGKRDELIDSLLGLTGDPSRDVHNEAYSAYWTLKWSDLIRNTSSSLGEQGMWALHNWIRDNFRQNRPFDQFVRELVTGKGSIYSNGPANYFRINGNSSELAESTAQLFLGVRLECAKCHHHPFEKYSQDDYYGFAAFFARVGTKTSEEFGLFGREQVVMVRDSGEVRHPRTGRTMPPKPLGAEPIDHPLDRRIALAQWLTSRDNAYFAKAVVNRYVYYLLGRGLVDPVDDLRSTNPPSNEELMDALADDFVDKGFDVKHLIRAIISSRLYQLESEPTPENASDDRFFSHFKVKRLPAEALLDAVDQATGVPTKFRNLPLGTRAIELPDAEYPNYFLNTFAKPRRASVCECERSPDESLAQALHTLNGDTLSSKINDKSGRLLKLLAEQAAHEQIVEQLYVAALCRYPDASEVEASRQFLERYEDARECYEDLLWALMNSKQFLFVR